MQIQRHISQEPCLSIQLPKEGALQNTMYKITDAIKHIYTKYIVKTKSYTYRDTEITTTLPGIQYIDIY